MSETTEQVIEFRIDEDGNVKLEVINGDGTGCEGKLAMFAAILGQVVEEGFTADHGRRRKARAAKSRAKARS